MRAVIIANGDLTHPASARALMKRANLVIAADGGAHHCLELGLAPDLVVGDFDSLSDEDLAELRAGGAEIIRYPARKDFTDLELALKHAGEKGAKEILIVAALGARWDQTLANMLLPAAASLKDIQIRLVDGPQEILLIRSGEVLDISGMPGDTVSLIPLGGDAHGITTQGLEYPLEDGSLLFGGTRGISNVLLGETASISLKEGLLLCILIHQE